MTGQDRIEELRGHREVLIARVQDMLATPEDQRPTSRTALRSWLAQLEGTQRALEQLDRLVQMLERKPKVRRRAVVAAAPAVSAASPDEADAVVVALIPKGPRAELRVTVKTWRGRRVVDIRCWSLRKDTGEFGPTRKGVAFDAGMLSDLAKALELAQKYA